MPSNLLKIMSGGQTGADRAAWDAAIEAGLTIGGFIPKGKTAEDGPIPDNYPNLTETGSEDPAERTRLNVINSDATLLFTYGPPEGGSLLTIELARQLGKPVLHVDLSADHRPPENVAAWIGSDNIRVLNIAGPRASDDPPIYDAVRAFLGRLFRPEGIIK